MTTFTPQSKQMRLDLNELRLWLVWFNQATDDVGRQRSLDQIIAACDRIGDRFPYRLPETLEAE